MILSLPALVFLKVAPTCTTYERLSLPCLHCAIYPWSWLQARRKIDLLLSWILKFTSNPLRATIGEEQPMLLNAIQFSLYLDLGFFWGFPRDPYPNTLRNKTSNPRSPVPWRLDDFQDLDSLVRLLVKGIALYLHGLLLCSACTHAPSKQKKSISRKHFGSKLENHGCLPCSGVS